MMLKAFLTSQIKWKLNSEKDATLRQKFKKVVQINCKAYIRESK